MAELLKGAPVANSITEDLIKRVEILKGKGIVPTLEILRIGENPEDLSYEKGALSRCQKVGLNVKHVVLKESATRDEILSEIKRVNGDSSVHGLLMFRPLKDKDVELEVQRLLDPKKDVDSMTPTSLVNVFTGGGEGFSPCTAEACIEVLKYYNVNLTGANVSVIGRSQVIGKPVSMLLQKENATVTMCHTKTRDLPKVCRNSDIIISAAGKANAIGNDFLKEGQIVIDVGINLDSSGKLCGDVDFSSAKDIVKAITPVPGGVGAVTTSILCSHVVRACEMLNK